MLYACRNDGNWYLFCAQLLNESQQFSSSHNLNEATKDHLVLRLESLLGIIEVWDMIFFSV